MFAKTKLGTYRKYLPLMCMYCAVMYIAVYSYQLAASWHVFLHYLWLFQSKFAEHMQPSCREICDAFE